MPHLAIDKKETALALLVEKFSLDQPYTKLLTLLLKHGRITLLTSVLKYLLKCCVQYKKEENFTITSSHDLSSEEKQKVHAFIQAKTKNTITSSFSVDPTLICGIKLQSDKHIWERSITKKLRIIQQYVMHKGTL